MSWLLKIIITDVLEWIAGKLGALFARWRREKVIDEESAKSVESLEKAKTAEEIDKASDEALNGL